MTLRDQCPSEINNTEKRLHPSIPSAKRSLLLKKPWSVKAILNIRVYKNVKHREIYRTQFNTWAVILEGVNITILNLELECIKSNNGKMFTYYYNM
jgi:hypothetical protein